MNDGIVLPPDEQPLAVTSVHIMHMDDEDDDDDDDVQCCRLEESTMRRHQQPANQHGTANNSSSDTTTTPATSPIVALARIDTVVTGDVVAAVSRSASVRSCNGDRKTKAVPAVAGSPSSEADGGSAVVADITHAPTGAGKAKKPRRAVCDVL